MYDFIGDLHGHCDELVELLRGMGYRDHRGAWRHPERTAVFVGDFLDRGPQIREMLGLVRGMLEAGTARAVLGNHEWNSFGFHADDLESPGRHLRQHSVKSFEQHRKTPDERFRGVSRIGATWWAIHEAHPSRCRSSSGRP